MKNEFKTMKQILLLLAFPILLLSCDLSLDKALTGESAILDLQSVDNTNHSRGASVILGFGNCSKPECDTNHDGMCNCHDSQDCEENKCEDDEVWVGYFTFRGGACPKISDCFPKPLTLPEIIVGTFADPRAVKKFPGTVTARLVTKDNQVYASTTAKSITFDPKSSQALMQLEPVNPKLVQQPLFLEIKTIYFDPKGNLTTVFMHYEVGKGQIVN